MSEYFQTHGDTLWAEGVPLTDIIQAVGTPCYIYAQSAIVQQWRAFQSALGHHPHQLCYAVKANSNLAVLQILAQLNAGFDIVSGGELARVLKAGGNPKQVVFSGVGKTEEEIAQALQAEIFCFNVESEPELETIQRIAQHYQVQAPIAFRVNPEIDPLSHPYISTGLKESKFGIDIAQAPHLYEKASKQPHLKILGIAYHIGSQITQLAPFVEAFQRVSALIEQLKSQGILLKHMDIGGGLGVRYQDETPPSIPAYIDALLSQKRDPHLTLLIEPGRAITAHAGILVTKVLYLKKNGDRQFCIVDAAMNDLLRPTLYSAWHPILPVQKEAIPAQTYDIVGPICENTDCLGKDRSLAISAGNYLAIMHTGAYGFVMSSNLNGRLRAPEVMVKNDQFKVIRARETFEHLWAQENTW